MVNEHIPLSALERAFAGVTFPVLATSTADGVPHVAYLPSVHIVDEDRLAFGTEFIPHAARNLVENPAVSVLVVDSRSYDEYRLMLRFERRETRGAVFERLRNELDVIAALTGLQALSNLRAAEIYRVLDIRRLPANPNVRYEEPEPTPAVGAVAIAELCARMTRCPDLDTLVGTTVDGLDQLLGYQHVHLLLVDESGERLYTMASRGFDADSVGAEVRVGHGIVGMAAARCIPIRFGNLRRLQRYAQTMRRMWEYDAVVGSGPSLPMPGLPGARSRMAVPAMARGEIVGVLAADSTEDLAFGPNDEAALSLVASLFASTFEMLRAEEQTLMPEDGSPAPRSAPASNGETTYIRHFRSDGSTFLDGDYLIKGVAGRILWSLASQYHAEGRVDFTNRELRLDPTLELPGFKDNLDCRLLLLTRRLAERSATIQLHKTGRGRFRMEVAASLRLEVAP
jgi:hypothetical protein